MKIIVDTNLVFSAVLNSSNNIAKILTATNSPFSFYSCNFLQFELAKHYPKLQKLTKASEEEINYLIEYITSKIKFIDEGIIPSKIHKKAYDLVKNIDENDTIFVALSIYLDGILWTGDLKLFNGLNSKKFTNIVTTKGLNYLLEEIQNG